MAYILGAIFGLIMIVVIAVTVRLIVKTRQRGEDRPRENIPLEDNVPREPAP